MERLAPGTTIAGKYRIERELGAGAMGAVYVAENVVLEKQVALKVLSGAAHQNPDQIERFLREGIAASRVHHPGIVEIYDAGEDAGVPWMAMELLDGESLEEALERRGQLEVDETVAMMVEVLEALALVHDRGIIHRDIKPANIFLARSPSGAIQPKVLDFGIAKQLQGTKLTAAGMVMGTAFFMAPEQAFDASRIDHRADLYSVGAVLFNCFSGQTPYIASTLMELISKLTSEDPRDLGQLAPWLPPDLVAAVGWCLRCSPEDRPQDARALLEALRPFASWSDAGSAGLAPTASAQSASLGTYPDSMASTPAPGFAANTPAPAMASGQTGAKAGRDRGLTALIAVIVAVVVILLLGVLALIGGAGWLWYSMMQRHGGGGGGDGLTSFEQTMWRTNKKPLFTDVNDDGVRDIVGWVFVVSSGEQTVRIAAYDGATGEQIWRSEALTDAAGAQQSRAAIADGTLIAVDHSATVHGLDLSSGQERWRGQLEDRAERICRTAAGRIVITTATSQRTVVAPAAGTLGPAPAGDHCQTDIDAAIRRRSFAPMATGALSSLGEDLDVDGMRVDHSWLVSSAGLTLHLGTRTLGTRVPMVAVTRTSGLVWRHTLPPTRPMAASTSVPETIACDGQRVVVPYEQRDSTHRLAAFALSNGQPLWDVAVPEDADEADLVVIDGGNVLVTHWVRLDVFDLATGAHRFRIGTR